MDRASALLCKLGQYCRSWCAPVWNGPVCLRLPAGLADLGMLQSASVYSSLYLPLRHQNTTSRTLHTDQAPHLVPTTLYSAPYPRKSAGFRHQSLGSKSGSIAGMECWLWRSWVVSVTFWYFDKCLWYWGKKVAAFECMCIYIFFSLYLVTLQSGLSAKRCKSLGIPLVFPRENEDFPHEDWMYLIVHHLSKLGHIFQSGMNRIIPSIKLYIFLLM